jgi:hypothetical protein
MKQMDSRAPKPNSNQSVLGQGAPYVLARRNKPTKFHCPHGSGERFVGQITHRVHCGGWLEAVSPVMPVTYLFGVEVWI